jgi:hypothetical protein
MELWLKFSPQSLQLALSFQKYFMHFGSLLGVQPQVRGNPMFDSVAHKIRISHHLQHEVTHGYASRHNSSREPGQEDQSYEQPGFELFHLESFGSKEPILGNTGHA